MTRASAEGLDKERNTMKFESIFEGWEKQSRCASDTDGGKCAYTYLRYANGAAWLDDIPAEIVERFKQIGYWIKANIDQTRSTWLDAIVWANDTGQLDIEGFKTVEKLVCGYVPEESAPVGMGEVVNERD